MIGEVALAALLRRDRAIVLTALLAVTVLAWSDVLHLANTMSGMGGMAGMDMGPSGTMSPVFGQWSAGHFRHHDGNVDRHDDRHDDSVGGADDSSLCAGRKAEHRGDPVCLCRLVRGWLPLAWTGFSLLATVTQWGLEQLALLSPMMTGTSHIFGGLLLIAAGIYQWLPLKSSCLARCRAPLSFVMEHGGFQAHATGSLRLGLQHGLYCIGCCWALMALRFVGGVMNLVWIAALMVFVLLEKLVPGWRYFSRASGLAAVGMGVWYLAGK